jgi:DNA-binding CsgD family transcriptional regulator
MPLGFGELETFRLRIDELRVDNSRLKIEIQHESSRLLRLQESKSGDEDLAALRGQLQELTPRELQVLQRIAEGESTKEVAAHLGITFKTAACHRHRLMQKLDVHGTGALVRMAIAAGLVKV